ncbi:MAG: hypothetical protein US42_C0011G0033 [Candidatus Magasanikbacteria bacterium GW2011_GWC2_37_14]|uniref:Glycosyltransferase RgtA/B/C/D-like domain-containing protein n=1 Tax=Candidatus Magasanikbacteria bacterium GW2011_GWC2_37_14 TaxID=1619046 RepID=A0A0G0GMA6_9BACT|nr:MAG: hypothetical protein US42_C0011G0033 [Candidatus Magasanikbacteria bacterium GW2011_GWC2_37_14]
MNRLILNGKYIILSLLITTHTIWAIHNPQSVYWGVTALCLYYLFFGFYAGIFLLPKENRFWKMIFGALSTMFVQIIFLTIIYWFYQFNANILIVITVLIPILIGLQKQQPDDIFANVEKILDYDSYVQVKSYLGTKFFSFLFILFDLALFFTLWQRQSTDTIISPWKLVGPRFFILFFISTLLLLWILQKSKEKAWNVFLIIIHSLLILNVCQIVYALGFGFDPIIHESAEKWIAQNGVIAPKEPYYLGQYMLVLTWNFISHLKITALDQYLVPMMSGIILPLVSYFSLSRTKYADKLFPALALIPLLPLSFLIMTTPNNLALLLFFMVIFWLWYEESQTNSRIWIFSVLLIIAITLIHPFIGLPAGLIYLLYKLWQRNSLISYFVGVPSLIVIIPLTLYANALRLGERMILGNPLNNLNNFLSIFNFPHWIWLDKGNLAWQALYIYRQAIVGLFVIVAGYGMYLAIKKYQEKITWFLIMLIPGLFIGAFVLATAVNFPVVISYEQKSYATRLLQMILIILLPFFIIALRELFIIIRKKTFWQFFVATFFALLLLISWYFTYPTRDPISFYTGYNIRAVDIQTIHFIDNRNKGVKDYIVLSNQYIAAAALREFSFAKYFDTAIGQEYFYSIPTGGPLYQYFRKMVYEQPKRQWMEEAMRFAGVKKAYFVHTNYWAPAGEIRDAAKLEADKWWELGEGRTWVYEYVLDK